MINQGELDELKVHAGARDVEVVALRKRISKQEKLFLEKLAEMQEKFDALQVQFDAFRASCTCGARDSAS